jgi:hypothetical protein
MDKHVHSLLLISSRCSAHLKQRALIRHVYIIINKVMLSIRTALHSRVSKPLFGPWRLTALPIIPLLAASCPFLSQAQFEIEGSLWVNSVSRAGDLHYMPQHDKTFMVSVSASQWQIAFTSTGYKATTGCDGTNAYYLVDLAASRNANAIIAGDASPRDALWNTRLIWWAFASGPYFKDHSRTSELHAVPTPWGNAQIDAVVYFFSPEVRAMKSAPYLPTNVLFRVSQSLVKRADKELQLIGNWKELAGRDTDLNRLEAEYCDKFLGVEYSVLEYTNYNGLTIPLRFCLQRFLPKQGLFEEYHGAVTKVREVSVTSFVPKPDRPTAVFDARFRDVSSAINGIRYTVTNGVWPAVNDKAILSILAKTPRNILRSRANERLPNRLIFLVVISLLIMAPAGVAIARRAIHVHNNQR